MAKDNFARHVSRDEVRAFILDHRDAIEISEGHIVIGGHGHSAQWYVNTNDVEAWDVAEINTIIRSFGLMGGPGHLRPEYVLSGFYTCALTFGDIRRLCQTIQAAFSESEENPNA